MDERKKCKDCMRWRDGICILKRLPMPPERPACEQIKERKP